MSWLAVVPIECEGLKNWAFDVSWMSEIGAVHITVMDRIEKSIYLDSFYSVILISINLLMLLGKVGIH